MHLHSVLHSLSTRWNLRPSVLQHSSTSPKHPGAHLHSKNTHLRHNSAPPRQRPYLAQKFSHYSPAPLLAIALLNVSLLDTIIQPVWQPTQTVLKGHTLPASILRQERKCTPKNAADCDTVPSCHIPHHRSRHGVLWILLLPCLNIVTLCYTHTAPCTPSTLLHACDALHP